MEATQGQTQHGAPSRQPGVSHLDLEQSQIHARKCTFFLLPDTVVLAVPLPGKEALALRTPKVTSLLLLFPPRGILAW